MVPSEGHLRTASPEGKEETKGDGPQRSGWACQLWKPACCFAGGVSVCGCDGVYVMVVCVSECVMGCVQVCVTGV